ncbi:hypothetical protein FHL15_008912 [Xylaria flabelliformis]|uniref:t-SNARE coiled-coil homology domain-containing protein n=1 Tax=Xylaria flabelliformis TaxID=2512241 RepID=A0A553HQE2_9PEZI|nr:hypothetical protein FHL15_008912 [Xylaria flabelliformis]
MKKFLGKKSSDKDDDPNRNALFGSKGSKGSQSENPYAQTASDQYTEDNTKYAGGMTRYQQARQNLDGGPGPQGLNRNDSVGSSATAPPPYSDQAAPTGYGNNRYGASSGYASNSKYAGSSYSNAPRQGGYGGLGRTDSASTDANRDALFSGARDRYQQQATTANNGGSGSGDGSGSYDSGTAASGSKYDGYGSRRELNEEEREAEEYRSLKDQIHSTTQASLATNQNSLRYMNQALDTGLATYARLGAQNERLHHTDQLLDTATESHRHAEAQTKKLKSLKPQAYWKAEEARIVQQNQEDREIREATRRDKFAQHSRMERNFAGFDNPDTPNTSTAANRGDRNKYMLEDDSDEESKAQLEAANDQIERDLEQMSIGVARLKAVGKAMGDELDHGNKLIDRIGAKTDPLDDQIRVTNARMNRIR